MYICIHIATPLHDQALGTLRMLPPLWGQQYFAPENGAGNHNNAAARLTKQSVGGDGGIRHRPRRQSVEAYSTLLRAAPLRGSLFDFATLDSSTNPMLANSKTCEFDRCVDTVVFCVLCLCLCLCLRTVPTISNL